MGTLKVKFCDGCGKREDDLPGVLTLYKKGKYSQLTVWSQKICKKCLNKFSSFHSVGDKIREDVELMIDKLRVKTNEFLLLENK